MKHAAKTIISIIQNINTQTNQLSQSLIMPVQFTSTTFNANTTAGFV